MTKPNVKRKFRLSSSNLVLVTGLLFVLVPSLIIGTILLASTLQTGTVIRGNRFVNDLDPAIDQNLLSLTAEALETTEGFDLVELNLKAATLRVTLTVSADLDEKAQLELSERILSTIDAVLPFATFFSATDSKKMYDLEVLAYDQVENPSTYFSITKNALMEEAVLQDFLVPKNPVLVETIKANLAEKENPLIPGTNGEETETEDSDNN